MIQADIPMVCRSRDRHRSQLTNGPPRRTICMELTSIILPIGGNVTRSSRDCGTRWDTIPRKETSSKPSSKSPLPISSGSSATNKRPRNSHIAGSYAFNICPSFIWESTSSLSLKRAGLFPHRFQILRPIKFALRVRPLLRLTPRRSSCG